MSDNYIRQTLLDRIYDLSRISQQDTNSCGPVSYIYALAFYCPDLYSKIVLDLYDKGKARLGKFTLAPDDHTRQSWDPKVTGVSAVDWIAIAGVKNSTSSDFDDPADIFAGITMPGEMTTWLEKTGWTIQGQDISIWGKGLDQLKAASREYLSSRTVFLFIKAKSAGNVKKGLWWGVDHWVVLSSSIQVRESSGKQWVEINDHTLKGKDISSYQIAFETYTWGSYENIGAKNTTSTIIIHDVEDFIAYFYGYIAATAPK